MNVGFFIFLNLFVKLHVKLSVDETNCENLGGAKPCESVSLKNRDLAESRETYVVLHSSSLSVASSITFSIEPIKLCKCKGCAGP